MSITDALKALCQKMTGEESTSNTIAGVIKDIAENYPDPAETAAENNSPPGAD